MPGKLGKGKVARTPFGKVKSLGFGKGLQFERMTEKRFWERWSTEKYGKYKAAMGMSIGGQSAQRGPDILKFIKQHDPQNSSGAVKDALDIMQKLQEGSTKPKDLFSSIQPLQSILGGGLYGKMKSAGAGSKASEQIYQPPEEEEPLPVVPPPVVAEEEDIIALLIAAALAMVEDADEKLLVAELLLRNEIRLIKEAFYGNGVYVSAQLDMPKAFVDAINYLIPIFRLKEGLEGAAVS